MGVGDGFVKKLWRETVCIGFLFVWVLFCDIVLDQDMIDLENGLLKGISLKHISILGKEFLQKGKHSSRFEDKIAVFLFFDIVGSRLLCTRAPHT